MVAKIKDGSGTTVAMIAQVAMVKPNSTIFGVAGGANPLEVLVPAFSVKTIRQSTPVSGQTNTLTVTLTANYDLTDGSTVTISGLTGTQTSDDGSLSVTSSNGDLGSSGAWTTHTSAPASAAPARVQRRVSASNALARSAARAIPRIAPSRVLTRPGAGSLVKTRTLRMLISNVDSPNSVLRMPGPKAVVSGPLLWLEELKVPLCKPSLEQGESHDRHEGQ